jgi:transcription termination factor Rho
MTVDSRTLERSDLEAKVLPELQKIAESLGVTGHQRLRKGDLISAILDKSNGDGHVESYGNGIAGDARASKPRTRKPQPETSSEAPAAVDGPAVEAQPAIAAEVAQAPAAESSPGREAPEAETDRSSPQSEGNASDDGGEACSWKSKPKATCPYPPSFA